MTDLNILLVVHPNTSKSMRLVLVSDNLADELTGWMDSARIPYQRDTTPLRAIYRTVEESSRVLKLLFDFRRANPKCRLTPGDLQ